MEDGVAPTDSRHRPDQRIMEGGDFDEANRVKVRERGKYSTCTCTCMYTYTHKV